MVVEIIANRLRRLRRQQLVEEVEEARSAYQRGEARRGVWTTCCAIWVNEKAGLDKHLRAGV